MTEAQLKQRIADNIWDADAWFALLRLEKEKGLDGRDNLCKTYEDLLARFPTAAHCWKEYCDLQIELQADPEIIKGIFGRCLLSCLHVPLWSSYLSFVIALHKQAGLEEARQAYEFTLEQIGDDVDAGLIWQEFIAFLQLPQLGTKEHETLYGPATQSQEGDPAKVSAVRKAYHRALVVPNHLLDSLWRSYEAFENAAGNNNRALTKRVLDEWRPKYQAAREALHDRLHFRQHLEGTISTKLPVPPGQGDISDYMAWAKYIQWEKTNRQSLDASELASRVRLAFEQALMPLIHYPDIWLEYAGYLGEVGGPSSSISILERARATLPNCLALHLAAVDAYEAMGELETAKSVYESLAVALLQEIEVQLPADQGTLMWVHYMRFVRRTEGILAARKLFMRARKWASLGWEAFVAAALLEWRHEHKDQISRNILELGLKQYLTEPSYILEYSKFLLGLGDVANARALFERALAAVQPVSAGIIWDAYLALEYEVGSIDAVSALEARRKDSLLACRTEPGQEGGPSSEFDAIKRSVLKHTFLDLWPATTHQKVHIEALVYPERRQVQAVLPLSGSFSPIPHDPNKLPRHLENLLHQMSSLGSIDDPMPTPDRVFDILLSFDLSPDGIAAREMAIMKERRQQRTKQQMAATAPGASKRKADSEAREDTEMQGVEEGESGGESEDADPHPAQPGLDVFRMRRKQRN